VDGHWVSGVSPGPARTARVKLRAGGECCGCVRLLRLLAVVVDEEVGELLLEGVDFGAVADQDVGVVGVVEGVVLVVGLGVVEAFEGSDFGDNGLAEDVGGVELGDVGGADFALLVVDVEDGGAVGGSDVGTLAVELGGVVDDGEEDAEEGAVGDLRGIVDNLDGLGVAGGFGGDLIVGGGGCGASGVACGGGDDSLDALKDGLRSPEASPGEDGGLFAVGWRERCVDLRCGDGGAGLGVGAAGDGEGQKDRGEEQRTAAGPKHEGS
jgi:hypothetical protein